MVGGKREEASVTVIACASPEFVLHLGIHTPNWTWRSRSFALSKDSISCHLADLLIAHDSGNGARVQYSRKRTEIFFSRERRSERAGERVPTDRTHSREHYLLTAASCRDLRKPLGHLHLAPAHDDKRQAQRIITVTVVIFSPLSTPRVWGTVLLEMREGGSSWHGRR